MNRWMIAALALICLATLASCKKNDASTDRERNRPEVVFVDPAERERLRQEALENYDHGAELESFLDGDIAGWTPSADAAIQGDQSWIETTEGIEKSDWLAANGILAYHAQTLVRRDRPGAKLEIELVRAENLMGAFSTYASYRDPAFDYETKGLGNQGFIDENRLVLWHSRWLARVEMIGAELPDNKIEAELIEVGRTISERMRAVTTTILPRYLRVFPGTEIVASSQRYDLGPFLGIEFLPRGLTAEYARPEGLLTAVYMDEDDESAAAETFDKLKAYLAESGTILDEYLGVGTESLRAELPGKGKVAFFLHRRFIGGFLGIESEDSIPSDLMQGFVGNLDSLFPDENERMFGVDRETPPADETDPPEGGATSIGDIFSGAASGSGSKP